MTEDAQASMQVSAISILYYGCFNECFDLWFLRMPCVVPWRHTQRLRDSSSFVITSAGRVLAIPFACELYIAFNRYFRGRMLICN